MSASGFTTIDFGAFPGSSDASVAVMGQAGIVAGSRVGAWIEPRATADHSADEHMLESIRVFADADSIVAGVGFTIRAFNISELFEPPAPFKGSTPSGSVTSAQVNPVLNQMPTRGGLGTRIYGQWTVAWAWL